MRAHELIDHLRGDTDEKVAASGPRLYDLVFIDADKKIYREYLQALMGEAESEGKGESEEENRRSSGRSLLAEGALVVVDNTLWKGLVLAHGGEDLAEYTPEAHLYGNPDRLKVRGGGLF